MSIESTPGVSVRFVHHPKRDGAKPRMETIFVFDLSRMTLATALADPRLSHDTMSEWTTKQLFSVMFVPRSAPSGTSKAQHKKELEALRPAFLRHLGSAVEGNPLNDKVIRLAARHEPEGSVESSTITAFRSKYSTPEAPEVFKNTVLHIAVEATILEVTYPRFGSRKEDVRDDLFRWRHPTTGFVSYIEEFRRLRLKPLQRLIAKNEADVRKALEAMAYVQQINVALSFAEDFSRDDRTAVWRDFFDVVGSLAFRYPLKSAEERRQLFLHGDDFCDQRVEQDQFNKLRDFRKTQLDPLIDQLGEAAIWAHAAETSGVHVCASAKKRDDDAKRALYFLRIDDTILDALDHWDDLGLLDRIALTAFFEDMIAALSKCPGAMQSLIKSEFLAVARGAASVVASIPTLEEDTSRQKQLAAAMARFDPSSLAEAPTKLTEVITNAFKGYEKARRIPPPIVSLWAHSTPAILARFDKLTPDRVNPEGTAYLLRSVFGMGLLSQAEMKLLWSDLDVVLGSAVKHGVDHKTTKRKLEQLFDTDLSHGKYPVRSNSWSDSRLFNSVKLAVGVLGIRQGFISAVDDGAISHETFITMSAGVLAAADGARGLSVALNEICNAGKSAVHHQPSFLGKLTPAAQITRLTALVSLVSAYQAVPKTDKSSVERDYATADVAVAWISLMLVTYEVGLATSFPVAGLALVLLRWVLFDQSLWDWIGGVTSESPAVKLVRGTMTKLEDEKGDVGKFLRLAPNWPDVAFAIERVRTQAPASVKSHQLPAFPLFFHLETDHEGAVRQYAVKSYGLADEVAELIVED